MNAYTMVEPTNRNPRARRSADSASDAGVVAGISPACGVDGEPRRRGRHHPGQVRVERAELLRRGQERPRRCRPWHRSWRRSGRSRRRPSAAPDRPVRTPPRPPGRSRGTPPGRPRACAGSSTTTARPGTTRARAARTARRRRGRACPIRRRGRRPSRGRGRAGPRRPRRSGVVARSSGHGSRCQGIGANPNSVLRSIGSVAGRRALKTERNTSPETVFVPPSRRA